MTENKKWNCFLYFVLYIFIITNFNIGKVYISSLLIDVRFHLRWWNSLHIPAYSNFYWTVGCHVLCIYVLDTERTLI